MTQQVVVVADQAAREIDDLVSRREPEFEDSKQELFKLQEELIRLGRTKN